MVGREGKYRRLVHGAPIFYSVTEILKANTGKIHEMSDNVAIFPAADLCKSLRKIPMKNVNEGLYPRRKKAVYNSVIVVDARLIYLSVALRENASPGDGEAEGLKPLLLHILYVLFVIIVEERALLRRGAVVEIGGVHTVLVIPDILTLSVGIGCALDLMRRRARA